MNIFKDGSCVFAPLQYVFLSHFLPEGLKDQKGES